VAGNEAKKLLGARRREGPPDGDGDAPRLPAAENAQAPEVGELAEQEWRRYVAALAWERIETCFSPKVRAAFEQVSRGDSARDVSLRLGVTESSVYVYKKRVQDRLRREIMEINRALD
jgi:DNA-directed RNA polymerase specialized sigma24 family protein